MGNAKLQGAGNGGEDGLPEVARARPSLEAGQDQAFTLCGVQSAAFGGCGGW